MWIAIIAAWLVTLVSQGGRWYLEHNSIAVRDQLIGESVEIDTIRVPGPALLVISGSVYGKPLLSQHLGTVEFFEGGTYRAVRVPISTSSMAKEQAKLEGSISQGNLVYAVLYRKNARNEEKEKRDIFGKLIAKPFRLN